MESLESTSNPLINTNPHTTLQGCLQIFRNIHFYFETDSLSLLYSSGSPKTHYVGQFDLELTEDSASAS